MVAESLAGGYFHVKGDPCQQEKKRRTIFLAKSSSLPAKGRRGGVLKYGERCSPADLILRTLPSDIAQPWPQLPNRQVEITKNQASPECLTFLAEGVIFPGNTMIPRWIDFSSRIPKSLENSA